MKKKICIYLITAALLVAAGWMCFDMSRFKKIQSINPSIIPDSIRPKSEINSSKSIIVRAESGGLISIDGTTTTPKELSAYLPKEDHNKPLKIIIIADDYSLAGSILDEVRKQGFSAVSMEIRQSSEQAVK